MNLRKAAEMALEDICGAKLCETNSMSSRAEMLRLMDKAAEALRQALAQPKQGNSSPNYPNTESNTSFVDAVNMSQECVDETGKNKHEAFTLDRGCWERGCVAYDERDGDGVTVYTAPSKREWVGLTRKQLDELYVAGFKVSELKEFAKAFEAKLKENNGY